MSKGVVSRRMTLFAAAIAVATSPAIPVATSRIIVSGSDPAGPSYTANAVRTFASDIDDPLIDTVTATITNGSLVGTLTSSIANLASATLDTLSNNCGQQRHG